ncbi:MAG TPA: sulfate ABC transporter ATP-binding protein [Tepidisphaeraceae bacterium]|nr:sulfate ABC transporter ATP-binding protein [Tepidisphaeraceae bacterium]
MSIELKNINKQFGAFKALDDVNLTIPNGQLTALLGPSGSGKTTLLRIIAGLETTDGAGQVLFDGEDVVQTSVRHRQVGFVFQHYALFRHMTVFENIAFGLRVRPRKIRPSREAINQRVRDLLKLIQLEGIEKRFPWQLSGGQRQRVALARALAIDPKVLLLDEPFGALDARVRQDLRRWLRRLHDEIHVTSVFVTHDQEEALEVADRIVVMNKGRIEQVGTPDEVFHSPANQFVMEFLGNVNLFHGRLKGGRNDFDSLSFDPADDGASKPARLLVRPHELAIHQQQTNGHSVAARIIRINSAGPVVKIELARNDGQSVFVELPHEMFHAEHFRVGSDVYVAPRHGRVFTEDYSI